jgi:hypothetical protein
MLISASSLMFGCAAIAQEPITAVYKAQEVTFHYRSSSQFYPCHELQPRIANILLAIGARDDIDVDVRNCDGYLFPEDPSLDPMHGRDSTNTWDRRSPSAGFGHRGNDREQSAYVRVRLMMPVEVTPQVLEEIDKDKSRRELVSRVTGNPAAALNEPIVFAARREEVTLSHRTIRLQPKDCGLLEQMTSQVFRKLGVRVIRKSFSCGPRESSRIPPQLTVEALVPTGALLPMPAPERKAGAGAAGDSVPETTEPTAETGSQ